MNQSFYMTHYDILQSTTSLIERLGANLELPQDASSQSSPEESKTMKPQNPAPMQ